MIPVYICAPYRGDVAENRRRAIALTVLALHHGLAPICPHVHDAAYLLHPEPDRVALEAGLVQVATVARVGGRLWVLKRDDGTLSEGCAAEHARYFDALRGFPGVGAIQTWAQWRPVFEAAGIRSLWEGT